ncbi:MAG TPA: glycosyltransferase family 2 protein [Candidatus Synoicihabitans sp.]|nr:glycosyltransferase family 2 protein [Candidatus Synoicihabitans sp.]
MSADVAIIIVSYNSERQLGDCLTSVFAQCTRVTQEVIVLDNNSTDGTVALVQSEFPQVKLITPGRNLGFAAGVNLAVQHTDAEFVLLLNPDTVLLDHATDVILEFARAHPQYGLYGGRTLREDGSLEPSSCWGLPSLWSLTCFASGLTSLAPRNRWLDPESLGTWPRDTVREVGIVTGCFLLMPRAHWQTLGGFDERYFMYGEDADLAIRARAAGLRPVICPDARLVHEVGQSSATPAAKMQLLYRGKASLVRTHWRGWRQRLGLVLLATGVGLRALASATVGRLTSHPSTGRWETVWRSRHVWLQGYPPRSAPSQPPLNTVLGYN